MNQKYKPGIYFAIIMAPFFFVSTMFIFPEPWHYKHIWGIAFISAICGILAGFIYSRLTIWYKSPSAKTI